MILLLLLLLVVLCSLTDCQPSRTPISLTLDVLPNPQAIISQELSDSTFAVSSWKTDPNSGNITNAIQVYAYPDYQLIRTMLLPEKFNRYNILDFRPIFNKNVLVVFLQNSNDDYPLDDYAIVAFNVSTGLEEPGTMFFSLSASIVVSFGPYLSDSQFTFFNGTEIALISYEGSYPLKVYPIYDVTGDPFYGLQDARYGASASYYEQGFIIQIPINNKIEQVLVTVINLSMVVFKINTQSNITNLSLEKVIMLPGYVESNIVLIYDDIVTYISANPSSVDVPVFKISDCLPFVGPNPLPGLNSSLIFNAPPNYKTLVSNDVVYDAIVVLLLLDGSVAITSDNLIFIVDPSTGIILNSWEVDFEAIKSFAILKDGNLLTLTKNVQVWSSSPVGYFHSISGFRGRVEIFPVTPDLVGAVTSNNIYANPMLSVWNITSGLLFQSYNVALQVHSIHGSDSLRGDSYLVYSDFAISSSALQYPNQSNVTVINISTNETIAKLVAEPYMQFLSDGTLIGVSPISFNHYDVHGNLLASLHAPRLITCNDVASAIPNPEHLKLFEVPSTKLILGVNFDYNRVEVWNLASKDLVLSQDISSFSNPFPFNEFTNIGGFAVLNSTHFVQLFNSQIYVCKILDPLACTIVYTSSLGFSLYPFQRGNIDNLKFIQIQVKENNIYFAENGGFVTKINGYSGAVEYQYKGSVAGINTFILPAFGNFDLITGDNNGVITKWNGTSATFENGHISFIMSLLVTNNGVLVSGSDDRTFKTWIVDCNQVGVLCVPKFNIPITCPAGTFCFNSQIHVCSSGHYCLNSCISETPCLPGYYSPDVGLSAPCTLKCDPGTYCPGGNNEAALCPAGFYCPTPGVIVECTLSNYCPAGSTKKLDCATLSPSICDSGSPGDLEYCLASMKSCKACALPDPGLSCGLLGSSINDIHVFPDYFFFDNGTSIYTIPCPTKTLLTLSGQLVHVCTSNLTSMNQTQCYQGFQGFLCSSCQNNYYDSGSSKSNAACVYCGNTVGYSYLEILASILGFALIVFVLARGKIIMAQKYNRYSHVHIIDKHKGEKAYTEAEPEIATKVDVISSVQRIVMGHMQVLAIIGSFRLTWPAAIKAFFVFGDTVTSVSIVGGFKCLFYFPGLPESYNELLILIYFFVFGSIGMCALWGCIFFREVTSSELKDDSYFLLTQRLKYKQKIVVSIVALVLLIYPVVTKAFFQTFSCVAYPPDIYLRVQGSLDWICFLDPSGLGYDHFKLILALGMPLFVIFVIGFPFATILKLWKHNKEMPVRKNMEIFAKYGFLFDGYSEKMWFWEAIVTLKKNSLSAIAVFLAPPQSNDINQIFIGTYKQGLVAILFLCAFAALQLAFHPYETYRLNRIESVSLLTSLVTVWMGMWLVDNSTQIFKDVIAALLVIVNISWVLFIVYEIRDVLKSTWFNSKKAVSDMRKSISVKLLKRRGTNNADEDKTKNHVEGGKETELVSTTKLRKET